MHSTVQYLAFIAITLLMQEPFIAVSPIKLTV